MAVKRRSGNGKPAGATWKKAQQQTATPSKRWQGGTTAPGALPKSREGRRRIRLAAMLVAGAGLFALLIAWLLYYPARTPWLYVSSTGYSWPLRPISWFVEDLARWEELNGQNLSLMNLAEHTETSTRLINALGEQLASLPVVRIRRVPMVIYVAMHGQVNRKGQPCLIPSGASPWDEEQWLPLGEILDLITAQLPKTMHKLLVLDCQREQANWQLGLMYNDFAERVRELMEEGDWPRTAVLLSTAPGQVSWDAPEVQSSIFSYFLRLGLAGDADDNAPGMAGNGDGKTSLRELEAYLKAEGAQWTRRNRAAEQTPLVLPESAEDFTVGWRLNRRTLRRLRREAFRQIGQPSAVEPDRLARLWERAAALGGGEAVRWDPIARHDWEHRLTRLEQLSDSGAAYREPARRLLAQIDADLARVEGQVAASAAKSRSIVDRWSALSTREDRPVGPIPAHGIYMSAYTGHLAASDVEACQAALDSAVASGDAARLRATLAELRERFPTAVGEAFYTLLAVDRLSGLARPRPHLPWTAVWNVRVRADKAGVPWGSDAALPGDERAHALVRGPLSSADALRRDAEDRLYGMTADAPAELEAQWDQVGEAYEAALRFQARATDALATRDRACAELGYLGPWRLREAARRRQDSSGSSSGDTSFADAAADVARLARVVHQVQQLGDLLCVDDLSIQEMQPLTNVAADVRREHADLARSFREAWEGALETHSGDALAWRMMEDLLSVPLIPGPQRAKLRTEQRNLGARLHADYSSDWDERVRRRENREPPAAGAAPQVAIPVVERSTVTALHPLPLLALQSDAARREGPTGPESPLDLADLDRAHGDIRQALVAIAAWDGSSIQSTAGGTTEAAPLRRAWALAEHRARVAAPLLDLRRTPTAIHQLRRLDLQLFLLWQAERAIHDFYGPAELDTLGEPVFLTAASDYLRAARELVSGGRELENRFASVEALLTQRRGANGLGRLQVWAEAPLAEGLDTPKAMAFIRGATSAQFIPPGRASLHVRRDDGGFEEIRAASAAEPATSAETESVTGVPLPLASGEQLQVALEWPADVDRRFRREVVVFFRGHEATVPLMLPRLSGIVVDYVPHGLEPPRVTLHGEQRQPLSTVLVLDCSASMERPLPAELLGGGSRPRLDAAKAALASLLTELSQRPDERVGVRLFGHRVGWSTTPPLRVLPQTQYAADIDPGLRPSEDVESILPLGRFGSIEAGMVLRRLERVRPWGQTPLYLALAQTMADFAREDPQARKAIVVITDGENYQFNPPNDDDRSAPPTTPADVLQAWETARVPVHILWFGSASGVEGEPLLELRALAERTGGTEMSVDNSRDLVRHLREKLGEATFVLRDQNGGIVGQSLAGPGEPARLNSPIEIVPPPSRPTTYHVAFGPLEKSVVLEGGEALGLRLTSDASDIVAESDDRPVAAESPLLEGSRGRYVGHWVRVYHPMKLADAVRFQVALRADGLHYTPRPAEAWIEVVPLRDGRPEPMHTYTFYDRNLARDTSLPTFSWDATQWPADAGAAHVRVWFNPRPTPPTVRIPCRQILEAPEAFASYRPLSEETPVRFRVQTRADSDAGEMELSVIESYTNPMPGVNAVRVGLTLPWGVRPRRVVHHFDSENALAMHTFVIAAADRPALLDANAALELTLRQDVHRAAWQLEHALPLVLEIPAGTNLVPPP